MQVIIAPSGKPASQGTPTTIDPATSKGAGGEAEVFEYRRGMLAKIFKQPTHPDFANDPDGKRGAEVRIAEHQQKLAAFPAHTPSRVIAPVDLVYDSRGKKIIGYTMRFVKGGSLLAQFAEKGFRAKGIDNNAVVSVFRNLRESIGGVHNAGIVIGDCNDLNIIVVGEEDYLIDADSWQFGGYICRVFTSNFVDPLLCDPNGRSPSLVKHHNEMSDWYAYNIMLMQCLLYLKGGPYGGVFSPKTPKALVPHPQRPLKRITVFHPEVRYPKPATPLDVLPDELLHHWHDTFVKDVRQAFPAKLLDAMRWHECPHCHQWVAKSVCPKCSKAIPGAVVQTIQIRGKVRCTRMFKTGGTILHSAFQGGNLLYLYNENGVFLREGAKRILDGKPDPKMKFRLCGDDTILAKESTVVRIGIGGKQQFFSADTFADDQPVFDTNSTSLIYASQGNILKDSPIAPVQMGSVVRGQTMFWAGEKFGFGFYRAGQVMVYFVFDTSRPGIKDSISLPPLRGQLVDASCHMSSRLAWFMMTVTVGSRTINRCHVINRNGEVVANAEQEANTEGWLGQIKHKCAIGEMLLNATDDGLVRCETGGGAVNATKTFPDTEPFLDAGCHILPAKDGIFAIDFREIRHLQLL